MGSPRPFVAPPHTGKDAATAFSATLCPVAPARPSASVRRKKALRKTPDGLPVHSFQTLLRHLATRCRNTCAMKSEQGETTFAQITEASPLHARALKLLTM